MSSATNARKKRSTVIRLSLAGLALVGIGAAATTAAWTDNVFFAAQASTSTFNLEGSVDGVSKTDNASDGTAVNIVVPAAKFANLTPGETRTADITVHNTGDLAALLDAPVVTSTGALFDNAAGKNPARVSIALKTGSTNSLVGKTGTATYTVTVVAPTDWSNAYQGQTSGSSISVNITGKSA